MMRSAVLSWRIGCLRGEQQSMWFSGCKVLNISLKPLVQWRNRFFKHFKETLRK